MKRAIHNSNLISGFTEAQANIAISLILESQWQRFICNHKFRDLRHSYPGKSVVSRKGVDFLCDHFHVLIPVEIFLTHAKIVTV